MRMRVAVLVVAVSVLVAGALGLIITPGGETVAGPVKVEVGVGAPQVAEVQGTWPEGRPEVGSHAAVARAPVTEPAPPPTIPPPPPPPPPTEPEPAPPPPASEPAPAPEPVPASSSGRPSSFTVADAVVPQVPLFSAPDQPLEGGRTMANPTNEGLDVVFLVKEQTPGWLRVQVSSRPNGMTAWVRSSDVSIRTVPNWIKVEVGARRATVFQGDSPLLTTAVAVGTSATPTPTGSFFVDGIVRLSGGGPYGAGQVSVAAFSDVLQEFGGGNGQIALHGTNAPQLLGQAVSNGCVRFADDMIVRVMDLAPTGTPVEIVP